MNKEMKSIVNSFNTEKEPVVKKRRAANKAARKARKLNRKGK